MLNCEFLIQLSIACVNPGVNTQPWLSEGESHILVYTKRHTILAKQRVWKGRDLIGLMSSNIPHTLSFPYVRFWIFKTLSMQ